MSERPKLRIVPFDPNDYSLAKVLVKESQTEINNPDAMGAILSLLFQWSSDAICTLHFSDSSPPTPISVTHDPDERNLEELWITSHTQTTIKKGAKAKIRVELFRQCYEFHVSALSDSEETPNPIQQRIITSVPDTITGYTQRRLPRVFINSEDAKKLPPCHLINESGQKTEVRVLEIGTRSIKVSSDIAIPPNPIRMQLGDTEITVETVRKEKDSAIFIFRPENNFQFGAIFDFYRLSAYPFLRPKHEFETKQLVELYQTTNYLSKFQTSTGASDRIATLETLWNDLVGEMHKTIADYVTIDESGAPVGASSAALGFERLGKPVWVFHQLCAVSSPSLLVQCGELYTWRAEYLASRAEPLDAMVWFDSKSRWLERIYVKFANHKTKLANLLAVRVMRATFESKGESSNNCSTKTLSIGSATRHMSANETSFAGMNPSYLNASGILDAVVCLNDSPSTSDICSVASALLSSAMSERARLELSVPATTKSDLTLVDPEILTDVDRLCYFQKESLVDFIASVEHSIAVTKRKKEQGELGHTA